MSGTIKETNNDSPEGLPEAQESFSSQWAASVTLLEPNLGVFVRKITEHVANGFIIAPNTEASMYGWQYEVNMVRNRDSFNSMKIHLERVEEDKPVFNRQEHMKRVRMQKKIYQTKEEKSE